MVVLICLQDLKVCSKTLDSQVIALCGTLAPATTTRDLSNTHGYDTDAFIKKFKSQEYNTRILGIESTRLGY